MRDGDDEVFGVSWNYIYHTVSTEESSLRDEEAVRILPLSAGVREAAPKLPPACLGTGRR
jgi:hypothetical protein